MAVDLADSLIEQFPNQIFVLGSSFELVRYQMKSHESSLSKSDFFSTSSGWLIIIDDITPTSSQAILDYFEPLLASSCSVGLPFGLSSMVILTSQVRITDARVTAVEYVDCLTFNYSIALLKSMESKTKKINKDFLVTMELREFVEGYISNHPLSLVQFGRLLCGLNVAEAMDLSNLYRGEELF